MISKKNNALIFDPKFTLPFKKHEMFGGVVHVSHMARKLPYFHMTTCGFCFFALSGVQRDVIFHEKNIHKILLDLLRK